MNLANPNLKVVIMDTDYYALQAVNSYLAWDRRTRVTFMAESVEDMWRHLDRAPLAEQPNVVIVDAEDFGSVEQLHLNIKRLQERVHGVLVMCMARVADARLIETAIEAGVRAYLLKGEVRLQIAWAVVFALNHDLVLSAGVRKAVESSFHPRLRKPTVLPPRREYPELTERIRQAIELCVVKGMPAQLAADEMGISLHTIRSYIKEGYRILETYDETKYPEDMSPQERAFMRLTRLGDDDDNNP